MLEPLFKKNDQQAKLLIGIFSAIVFIAVSFLSKFTLTVELPFDKHVFAFINAIINSLVAFLLVLAIVAVKQKKFQLHKRLMLSAMVLSVLFLVTYIAHHLFAGEAKYAGDYRGIYLIILASHIILAATSLPFILFTAYRALTNDFPAHKKLAKKVWPIWFYVAITGPIVYWMIKPFYT